MTRALRSCVGLTVALALFSFASNAAAKRTGMNLPCHNCHEGQDKPQVTAELSAARVEPGQALTITVTAKHARAKVGGVLVDSKGVGGFELIDSVGTRLFDNTTTQVTHAMPQQYVNGQVQFSFRWIAPSAVGPVELEVWSNAANDNLKPMDDSPSEVLTAVSVGCDAVWYYVDADKDGAGAEKGRTYSCVPVPDRILQGGDCNDQNPQQLPGLPELCNSLDDNCDGTTDEGFQPLLLVADGDGDGYGARTGMTMIGCPPQPGYAPSFDDCDDRDPLVNPGATEITNTRDDNCNGQYDEAPGPAPGGAAAPAPADSGCALALAPGTPTSPFLLLGPALLARWLRRRYRELRP